MAERLEDALGEQPKQRYLAAVDTLEISQTWYIVRMCLPNFSRNEVWTNLSCTLLSYWKKVHMQRACCSRPSTILGQLPQSSIIKEKLHYIGVVYVEILHQSGFGKFHVACCTDSN